MPSTMVLTLILIGFLAALAQAATVTYDFNFTWVHAYPDGAFDRPVIGINNQWPLPMIEGTVGDEIVVSVHNQLGNRSTSLHFHGLYQNRTNFMDGAVGATQCLIPPGSTVQYKFNLNQTGTYWYHAHNDGQYPDGLRGPLIIHDPEDPFKDQYDEEMVLTLSDWYHDFMPDLIAGFLSVTNPTGAEPVPKAALLNDTQNLTISVQPGKTYKLRIVNMAAFAPQYLWFEGHTMSIVEVDGIYTEPTDADMIYLSPAQRYSVLITMKNDTTANFPFMGSMDTDLFDVVSDSLNPNVTGWLVYDSANDNPDAAMLDEFEPFDDFTLVPRDGLALYDQVDYSIQMDFKMDNLGDGAKYAFINNSTYTQPKVPTLYSALSTGASAADAAIYGPNTNAFVLEKDQVVEIILNSRDPGKHPFHLHGHNFQAIARSEPDEGPYANNVTFPAVPMRRDTFQVHSNGNIVLRFKANNPGVWLFHCHLEWHMRSGLVATMIEAPLALQAYGLSIPQDHAEICTAQGHPIAGNAAGNTKDLMDLTGAYAPPGPLPEGFEPRGIAALVMTIICALLGVAVIVWYGVGDIKGPAGRPNTLTASTT